MKISITAFVVGSMLASAAVAQKVGDTLNTSGSTLLMDGTSMMKMDWQNQPQGSVPLTTLSQTTKWVPGLDSFWSDNVDGTGPLYWSSIGDMPQVASNPAGENVAYPSFLGIQTFGVNPFSSPGAAGPLTIQPVLAPANVLTDWAKRTLKGGPNPYLNRHFVSGAATTWPAGIGSPAYVEFTAQLPNYQGTFPAFWMLNEKRNWPACEIDIIEIVNPNGNNRRLTTSIHALDHTWAKKVAPFINNNVGYADAKFTQKIVTYIVDSGNDTDESKATQDINVSWEPANGQHSYGALLYANQISIVWDGKIVQTWPAPVQCATDPQFPLFNQSIGGNPQSWSGALANGVTTVPPMVISGFKALRMPATYASGTVIPPPPPPPPAPTTNFSVTAPSGAVAQPFMLTGLAGTQWVNVAVFDQTGKKVSNDNAPFNGVWTVTITGLPTGVSAPLTATAFSVAAGQPGGVTANAAFTVNVAPVVVPPPPPVVTQAQLTAALAAIQQLAADLAILSATVSNDNAAIKKALGQ